MLNNYAYVKVLKRDCNCFLPRAALITLGVQEGRMCELRRFTTAARVVKALNDLLPIRLGR